MPAGLERYQVDGGGAFLVQLHAGDRVNIRNLKGGQTAERLTIGGDGRCDARALGTPCNAQGDGVRTVLTSGNTSLQRVRRKLDQLGAKLANAPSLRLFDSATHPGASEDVTVNHTAYLLVTVRGRAMPPHAHNTLTPLVVLLTRAQLRPRARFDLPDPLADPLADSRVPSAPMTRPPPMAGTRPTFMRAPIAARNLSSARQPSAPPQIRSQK